MRTAVKSRARVESKFYEYSKVEVAPAYRVFGPDVIDHVGRVTVSNSWQKLLDFEKAIYIVEFKYGQSAEAALRQCREKRYADAENLYEAPGSLRKGHLSTGNRGFSGRCLT